MTHRIDEIERRLKAAIPLGMHASVDERYAWNHFVAHAQSDIAYLLDELRAAHRERDEWKAKVEDFHDVDTVDALQKTLVRAYRAERERDEMRAATLDLAARMAEVRMSAVTRDHSDSFARGWQDACVALAKAYRALPQADRAAAEAGVRVMAEQPNPPLTEELREIRDLSVRLRREAMEDHGFETTDPDDIDEEDDRPVLETHSSWKSADALDRLLDTIKADRAELASRDAALVGMREALSAMLNAYEGVHDMSGDGYGTGQSYQSPAAIEAENMARAALASLLALEIERQRTDATEKKS
jgi:hypothetical protein